MAPKLYMSLLLRFLRFLTVFEIKKRDFLHVFALLHTFSRTMAIADNS